MEFLTFILAGLVFTLVVIVFVIQRGANRLESKLWAELTDILDCIGTSSQQSIDRDTELSDRLDRLITSLNDTE